jgi:hypothetical protein
LEWNVVELGKKRPRPCILPLTWREQEVTEEECQRAEDRSVQMPTPSNTKVFWYTRLLGAIITLIR